MGAYRLTRLADEDLVEIARYTGETWGEEQRDAYLHELFEIFDSIGKHPLHSAKAGYIMPGLRKRLHAKGRHAVYFRIGPDQVPEILRILHTRQDSKARLREG